MDTRSRALDKVHQVYDSGDTLESFYDDWDSSYDEDVHDLHFAGPGLICDLLLKDNGHPAVKVDVSDPKLRIIDVGCGTGLVGKELARRASYRNLTGVDLSRSMLSTCERLGVYAELKKGKLTGMKDEAESRLPYPDDQFDVTLCCGVFTLGHVHPKGLLELVRITRPGGLVVFTTKVTYFATSKMQSTLDGLSASERWQLVDRWLDRPYVGEPGGEAHYWKFVVM